MLKHLFNACWFLFIFLNSFLFLCFSPEALLRCMLVCDYFFYSFLFLHFQCRSTRSVHAGFSVFSFHSFSFLRFSAEPILFCLPVQSRRVHVMSLFACMRQFCHAIKISTSTSLEACNVGYWGHENLRKLVCVLKSKHCWSGCLTHTSYSGWLRYFCYSRR